MADQQQPSQQEIDEARAKARDLAQRIENEEDFARKIADDPIGTLQAEGLSADAAKDLYRESGAREKAEVSGFDWDYPCWRITCVGTDWCVRTIFWFN